MTRPLPPYRFLPGGPHPHPEKEGGHYYGVEIKARPLDPQKPEESEEFRHAIDLFNGGYHWEAHVWLEALWNAHGRSGPIADGLKGLIKVCAAAVQERRKAETSAGEHRRRALELLAPLPDFFLGLDLPKLRRVLNAPVATGSIEFKPPPG